MEHRVVLGYEYYSANKRVSGKVYRYSLSESYRFRVWLFVLGVPEASGRSRRTRRTLYTI